MCFVVYLPAVFKKKLTTQLCKITVNLIILLVSMLFFWEVPLLIVNGMHPRMPFRGPRLSVRL